MDAEAARPDRSLGERLALISADLRHAARALRRDLSFTTAAVATFALGVAAATAIFSAASAVLLRPLPFAESDRLVVVWEESAERNWRQHLVSPANHLDWSERMGALSGIAAYGDGIGRRTVTNAERPFLVSVALVTGNFFHVLQARPAMGRVLESDETWSAGGRASGVLGDRVWRQRFGADSAIIGRTIELDGQAVRVVGVMPASFAFPSPDVDVWMATAWLPAARDQAWFRRGRWLRTIGRLRPGVTVGAAREELRVVAGRLAEEFPLANGGVSADLAPIRDHLVGSARRPLLVTLGAVGLLLLIACGNVGTLFLARVAGRERETAVRLALGAPSTRILQYVLVESLLLAAVGGTLGFLLGWYGVRGLELIQPPELLHVSRFPIDWRVLTFGIGVTAAAGLLFSIAPLLWSRRRTPAEALKEGGHTIGESRRRTWGQWLVVTQVALALLLASGAGLLVRSVWHLRQVDAGFRPEGVITLSVNLPNARYTSPASAQAFFEELAQRAGSQPEVSHAALVSQVPLAATVRSSPVVLGRGGDVEATQVLRRTASPGYFATMRVPFLAGRDFTASDRRDAEPVVIVNDVVARTMFANRDVLGHRLAFTSTPDSTTVWRTVIGVVTAERQTALGTEPQPEVFTAFAQERSSVMTLVLASSGDPGALMTRLRTILDELDPALAVESPRAMDGIWAASFAKERFFAILLFGFAAIGLVLSLFGVYGLAAELARTRTREIGLRLAIGARPMDVFWMVVRQGLGHIVLGLVIGAGISVLATRSLAALLYGVTPSDVVTLLAVAGIVLASGVAALSLPALGASKADPLSSLRLSG